MFDPITGPGNPYMGPATGLGTEGGDNWDAAIAKINAGFKNVVKAIEGGLGMSAPDDVALGERLSHIEDSLTALQMRIDAMTAPADPNAKPVTMAETAAETPPPLAPVPAPQPAAAPAPAEPAPIAAAIPVTTATTYIGAGGPATPAA